MSADISQAKKTWLLPKQIKVTLLGKNYMWPMPVRRVRREQEADILDIAELYRGLDTTRDIASITEEEAQHVVKKTAKNAAISRRIVNRTLEFFERHHEEIAGDMDKIEAAIEDGTIQDDEIVTEFVKIQKAVLDPLLRKGKQQAAPTSNGGSGNTGKKKKSSSMS